MESTYVIVSTEFKILALSAGCIALLNLSKNTAKKGPNFAHLAPDIANQDKFKLLKSLKGEILEYTFPSLKQEN